MHTFGETLARRRRQLDLTQEALAQRVGCSLSAIRKIESGVRRPSQQIAELLFEVLEFPVSEREHFLKAARGIGRFLQPGGDHPPAESLLPPSPSETFSPALPIPPSALIGRTAELSSLHRLVADPYCRLITLIGPGGIGKTRLALEVAHVEQTYFDGQVYFIRLEAINAPHSLLPALASALGLGGSPATEQAVRLREFLRPKRVLLVLDNFEPLIEAATVLTDLLNTAPLLKILVTSRERLRLQGEWTFEVDGLASPPSDEIISSEHYPALLLFEQRARQLRSGLTFSPAERRAAADICARVGGMPLAIELAATWTESLTCTEIAAEIERDFDFLSSSLRDLPDRHRSLRAVFQHSWERLSPVEQEVLSRLTIFQGGFRREAAEAVAGANPTLLAGLLSKSLLRRASDGRFDLHQVIRQYAAESLQQTGELQRRFSTYHLNLLIDSAPALFGASDLPTAQRFFDEGNNLWLAWQLGLEHESFAALDAALESLWQLCDVYGWLTEGLTHTQALVNALRQQPASPLQTSRLGHALAFWGMLAFRAGDYLPARRALEEAIALLRGGNAASSLTPALIFNGIVAALMGDFDNASACMDEGAALAEQCHQYWFLALARFDQGFISGQQGDLDRAYHQMQAGLSIWREIQNTRFIAFGLNFFSPVALQLGKVSEARTALTESMGLASHLHDRWGMGTACGRLGLLELEHGSLSEAENLLQQSLALFTELGARWDIAWALTGLGKLYVAQNLQPEAESLLRRAIRLAMEAQALPQALEASIELSACWLCGEEIHPQALALLAAASAHPALTESARRRIAALSLPLPQSEENWERQVQTILSA